MVWMHYATAATHAVATAKIRFRLGCCLFFFCRYVLVRISNRLFMYNAVSLIICSVKVYSSLSPSSSFTRSMLFIQVSPLSQASSFSNRLQDLQLQHTTTCVQRWEEEAEEKTHSDTDLREPEALESQKGLVPRTNCIRCDGGFQAPNL